MRAATSARKNSRRRGETSFERSEEETVTRSGGWGGAGVHLNRGYIDPGLAMPVMLGVLLGSLAGARVPARARTRLLRISFSLVILLLGVEMIYNGLTGRF